MTLFNIERGMKVAVPTALARDVGQRPAHLVAVHLAGLLLEGFGPIVFQRNGDDITVDGGMLQLEVP